MTPVTKTLLPQSGLARGSVSRCRWRKRPRLSSLRRRPPGGDVLLPAPVHIFVSLADPELKSLVGILGLCMKIICRSLSPMTTSWDGRFARTEMDGDMSRSRLRLIPHHLRDGFFSLRLSLSLSLFILKAVNSVLSEYNHWGQNTKVADYKFSPI